MNYTSDEINEDSLENKWKSLKAIISSMLDYTPDLRPTCAQILSANDWQIMKSEIEKYSLDYLHIFENVQDNFFKNYFKSRIELLNNSVNGNESNDIQYYDPAHYIKWHSTEILNH